VKKKVSKKTQEEAIYAMEKNFRPFRRRIQFETHSTKAKNKEAYSPAESNQGRIENGGPRKKDPSTSGESYNTLLWSEFAFVLFLTTRAGARSFIEREAPGNPLYLPQQGGKTAT